MPDLSGLDTSFGNNGVKIVGFDLGTTAANDEDQANAIALQPNGSIVLAGAAFTDVSPEAALVRLTSGGQIDATFGSGGKVLQQWVLGLTCKL